MTKINKILSYALVCCCFAATHILQSCDKYLDVLPDNRAELNSDDNITELLTNAYPLTSYFMLAELFMGIYFNLSFWYKLIDKTWWGAVMSGIGAAVMITINIVFVPKYGYMACAWGGFAGYGTCMLLSYFIGQKKSPINYPLMDIFKYVLLAVVLYVIYLGAQPLPTWLALIINTVLIGIYLIYLVRKDLPLSSLPVIGKYFRK